MPRLAGRVLGWPLASKPSSTCAAAMSGTIFAAGASRSSLPCSTSCMAPAAVMALVIDAIHMTVSTLIGAGWPSTRLPNAPS
jgi:hypothetical protein